jgi:hypothetical protein
MWPTRLWYQRIWNDRLWARRGQSTGGTGSQVGGIWQALLQQYLYDERMRASKKPDVVSHRHNFKKIQLEEQLKNLERSIGQVNNTAIYAVLLTEI